MKPKRKQNAPICVITDLYGFTWGPVSVIRLMHRDDAGSVCLGLKTKKHKEPLQVYVLRGGKIRIFGPAGIEWGPKEKPKK